MTRDFLARVDRELATGNTAGALVTAMLAAQMGPRIFRLLPRWLLERLTAGMMSGEEKKAKPGEVTVRMLAPTLRYDFQLMLEAAPVLATLSGMSAKVLLLGGRQSPGYLHDGLDTLQKLLPKAQRVELAGAGHGATGNANRGGKPALATQAIRAFLTT